jgi:hypothetical protein
VRTPATTAAASSGLIGSPCSARLRNMDGGESTPDGGGGGGGGGTAREDRDVHELHCVGRWAQQVRALHQVCGQERRTT